MQKLTLAQDRAALVKMDYGELDELCSEIRGGIIAAVGENGGHLASNLGAVELTVALHRVLDLPREKLFFDVGHQCYTHKMLTGRGDGFDSLRTFGGLSGFCTREESPFDPATGGHSGAAVSAAVGAAQAERILGSGGTTAVVVGDGSFTNGMVYEALNSCTADGGRRLNLIIVLNDNNMSISRNVGALSNYLSRIRTSEGYFSFKTNLKSLCAGLPVVGKPMLRITRGVRDFLKRMLVSGNFFEHLGIEYLGPVDGHNIRRLETVLAEAKRRGGCCLVHVKTVKGRGDAEAMARPSDYHSVSPKKTDTHPVPRGKVSFSSEMGRCLCELAEKDDRVCAVTAAMGEGTGLTEFAWRFPERFFDVGIAEEHALSSCGGLSCGGLKPLCAIYSPFVQRVYDQIWHDIAMQGLGAVIAVDRAGLVPNDGMAHQGIYDVSMLGSVPGIRISCPDSLDELGTMLRAALGNGKLEVIRYPKGGECLYDRSRFNQQSGCAWADFGSADKPVLAVVTYGRISASAAIALEGIEHGGKTVRMIRLKTVCPLPENELEDLLDGIGSVLFVEEGVRRGGAAESFAARFGEGRAVAIHTAPDGFIPHGDTESLDRLCGFLPEQLKTEAEDMLLRI